MNTKNLPLIKIAHILAIIFLVFSLYIQISHEASLARIYVIQPFLNFNFTLLLTSVILKYLSIIILLNKQYTKIAYVCLSIFFALAIILEYPAVMPNSDIKDINISRGLFYSLVIGSILNVIILGYNLVFCIDKNKR